MRILALTNLYPPHHAGTFDERCKNVLAALTTRGHQVQILTSTHGMRDEQRDGEIERRLTLNGIYSHELVTKYKDLKAIETHNHEVLRETIQNYSPEVIHVFSLAGLSKSLKYTLRNTRIPTVYDVGDHWVATGIRQDPWLRFWNAPSLPFMEGSARSALEMSGERSRMDSAAPTRIGKGYDRLPSLFGSEKQISEVEPNSIPAFRFDRVYFCSHYLKNATEDAGFCVTHAEVIYPGIKAEAFVADVRTGTPLKFLIIAALTDESGVLTAVRALKKVRDAKIKASLAIYGKGETKYVAELRSFVVREQLPVEFLTVSNLQKDMPAVYRKYDAFLHTAEWPEPFPTTLLEAMAAGLPVIAANSGGVPEIIRHGENGLNYTPGDFEELASRIQELQMQPALRQQMVETAQEEVLSRYNESTAIDQIERYLSTSLEVWAQAAT